jgi:hypothetical protein
VRIPCFPSLLTQYLARLQSRTGFRCRSIVNYTTVYPLDARFGGFSGLIDYFASCASAGSSRLCECDMGVSAFTLSSTRLAKVDFVAAFSAENYHVLTSRALVKSTSSNKLFFFKTFSWPVWIAIFALLSTHVLVTAMDSNFAPPRGTNAAVNEGSWRERLRHFLLKSGILFRVRHSYFNGLFHLVGQTVDMDTHKSGTKEKVMNLLVLIIGIFLLSIFQASVTYQVLVDEPISKFRSTNDFKSCRIPPNEVCLLKSGASRAFWDKTIAPSSYVQHRILPILHHLYPTAVLRPIVTRCGALVRALVWRRTLRRKHRGSHSAWPSMAH